MRHCCQMNFIDNYMVDANGEFVKVYLFLLRHLDDPCSSLTLTMIADCLNNTEADVLRAFRYWEKKGLLRTERDADGKINALELQKMSLLRREHIPRTGDRHACPGSAVCLCTFHCGSGSGRLCGGALHSLSGGVRGRLPGSAVCGRCFSTALRIKDFESSAHRQFPRPEGDQVSPVYRGAVPGQNTDPYRDGDDHLFL